MADERGLGTFVEVATHTIMGEALAEAAALEGAGLEVFVRNEQIANTLPYLTGGLGGIGLCVPAEEAAEAREVLASARAGLAPPAGIQDGAPGGEEASPEALPPGLDSEPLQEDPRVLVARRAWRAAVLGFVFLPVVMQLLSMGQLLRLSQMPGPVPAQARRLARRAWILNGLFALAVALVIVFVLHPELLEVFTRER